MSNRNLLWIVILLLLLGLGRQMLGTVQSFLG